MASRAARKRRRSRWPGFVVIDEAGDPFADPKLAAAIDEVVAMFLLDWSDHLDEHEDDEEAR